MNSAKSLIAMFMLGCVASTSAQSDRGPERGERTKERQLDRDRGQRDHARRGHGDREAFKQRMLERFDANEDGELDESERAAAKEAFHAKQKERRENMKARILERFDADGDGELSEAEREAAGEAIRKMKRAGDRRHDRRHRMGREMMQRFDTNEDGKLDETEKAAAKAFAQQKKAELIERFDTDGNGKIDGDERAAVKEHMIAEHAKRKLDINRDGVVDELDVQVAANKVAAGERIPDFNKDGQIDAADVSVLIEKINEQK